MKLFPFRTSLHLHVKSYSQKIAVQFFNSESAQTRFKRDELKSDSLYGRISPFGDPDLSITPILDKWVSEGKFVDKKLLHNIVSELKFYKRFKHALEVSYWMTDKRCYPMNATDVAMRMNLIFRVHGLEQVENYFSSIPKCLKSGGTHLALLTCYSHAKSVDKAEVIMQKARDIGWASTPLWYNLMMNLHSQLGNWEKIDGLMNEMEQKCIHYDKFSLTIRLSAYAAAGDPDGMDRIVRTMQSDPQIILSWNEYAIAANGYLKVNLIDRALEMLNMLESLMARGKRKEAAFIFLFQVYAETGKKDELYRIWNEYMQNKTVVNRVYRSMMSSLMKFDDIEGLEKIFEEWESRGLSYDFRIPNILIDAFCRKGNLEKAEAVLNRGVSNGGSPNVMTWCHLAGGYIMENQVAKAENSLKKAIPLCPPKFHRMDLDALTACLEYIERGNTVEKFTRSLRMEGISSSAVLDKLFSFIKDGGLQSYSGSQSGKESL